MDQADFARAVEADLRARGVPFERDTLRRFLEDTWPLVQPGQTPRLWADAYLESMGEEPPA